MTTRRPWSSERATFRGLRCLQTPFGQALAANGRKHPAPGRGHGNQYDVIRSGCPNRPASHEQPRQHWHQRPRLKIHRGMC